MEVSITKGSGVALVNPVYFKVTSLTVDDAIARGVIGEFEDENPFSPNRASKLSVCALFPPLHINSHKIVMVMYLNNRHIF